MAPTIFIVPGIYEGPEVFAPLASKLNDAGFKVHATHLLSTGTRSPGNASMHDDSAFIATELAKVVDEAGTDGVLGFMHSAGGFLGSGAMEGLSAKARSAAGKTGGVRSIVFLTAGLLPEGVEHHSLPFMEFHNDEGYHVCADPRNNLFNDLSDEEAEKWVAKMAIQPSQGWDKTVNYCGWREVPTVYILPEEDKMIPAAVQEQIASLAGCEVLRLKGAGHMAQISRTGEVADIVIAEAKKLE